MDEVTEQQVRESISTAKNHLEQAAKQIVWQVRNKVWIILGYSSWSEMVDAEYGGVAAMVPRDVRQGTVSELHAEGLSQRDIAKTLGVSVGTINADVGKFSSELTSQERVDSTGRTRPTTYRKQAKPEMSDEELAKATDAVFAAEKEIQAKINAEREAERDARLGAYAPWLKAARVMGAAVDRMHEVKRIIRPILDEHEREGHGEVLIVELNRAEGALLELRAMLGESSNVNWDEMLKGDE